MDALQNTNRLQEMMSEISILISAKRTKEALVYAEKAYEFAGQNFGAEHINTAVALSTLGSCLSSDGQQDAAREKTESAIDTLLRQPENCDLQTAQARNNISVIYRKLFMPQKALFNATEALRIRAGILGSDHSQTAVTISNIGFIFSWMGLVDVALACYRMAASLNPSSAGAFNNYKTLIEALEEDTRLTISPSLPVDFELTITALLALSNFILSKPLPEELFLITHGQPAHRESYNHYILQLKSAVLRLPGSEDRQQADLLTTIRNAQHKLCANASMPVYSGKLLLKRIERSSLHALGLATLTRAFPGFSTEMSALKKELGIISKNKTFTDLKIERAKASGLSYTYTDKQYRRYAGDNNLPPSCYYSLCQTADGDDAQTMCKELFEYTDPDIPGYVWVGDSWDTEFMHALGKVDGSHANFLPGIYVLLLPPVEEGEKHFYHSFYAPVFKENGNPDGLSIIHIPIETISRQTDNVVDMRMLETQQWLKGFFGMGDGAVFLKEATIPPTAFTDMLPALTYPEYGGSGVTKSIGTWLRLAGVGGLVYPSARADAGVEYDTAGTLTGANGWNFVDYSTSSLVPDRETHLDLHEWYGFVAGRQAAPVLRTNGNSWKIEGAEKRYQDMRRQFIDLLNGISTQAGMEGLD